MALAIIANLAVGLLFAGVGAIMGAATRRGVAATSYFFFGAVFISLVLGTRVRWDELGHMPQLGALVGWLALGAAANATGHLLMMHNMRTAHKAASWAIGQSAMVLPFLLSVLLWHDRPGVGGWAGVALVLTGIAFLATARREGNVGGVDIRWVCLALANFFCYGLSQTMMGVPSRWEGFTDPAHLRPFLNFSAAIPVYLAALLIRRESFDRRALPYSAIFCIVASAANTLIFFVLDRMTACDLGGSVWPIAIGAAITGFSIFSHLRLKESFSRGDLIGGGCILAGMAFLALH